MKIKKIISQYSLKLSFSHIAATGLWTERLCLLCVKTDKKAHKK